jgi:hypothetical protein
VPHKGSKQSSEGSRRPIHDYQLARDLRFPLALVRVAIAEVQGFKMETVECPPDIRVAEEREAEQKKLAQTKAALQATNTELEERILSYIRLVVTKRDYEQLTKAAETLQMAQRTWEAAKGTEP